jgi:hypothetical protein
MPETAVDEDDSFIFRQHDVWLAGEILHMQTKAIAQAMEEATDDEFRTRVFGTDAAHVPGATLGCQSVAHDGSLKQLSAGR